MALWFVMAAVVVMSFASFTMSVSPEAEEMTRKRVAGNSAWVRLGCAAFLSVAVVTAGWVWWAFQTGDWRYAVIGLGPFVGMSARKTFQAIVWPRWKAQAERSSV